MMQRLPVTVCALSMLATSACPAFFVDGLGGPEPGPDAGEWTVLGAYPCGFNRTDALHIDDDGTLWTGCGTNTEGDGLFVSDDDGASWSVFAPSNAPTFFESYRVTTISRSADGFLYVGGTGSGVMVSRIDPATDVLETVLEAGNQVGFNFTVGSFRRDENGRAIAESLTGVDALVRASDTDDFIDADIWANLDARIQLAAVALDGNTFHGVGSVINAPNTYFEEVASADSPIAFNVIELSGGALGFDGELRAVAVGNVAGEGARTVVVGGVNEDSDDAVIYAFDAGDSGGATAVFVNSVVDGLRSSTVRGACATDGHFFVVGEETLASGGNAFVIHSNDGVTWEDITMPGNPGLLSACAIVGTSLVVAGAGGYVARFNF